MISCLDAQAIGIPDKVTYPVHDIGCLIRMSQDYGILCYLEFVDLKCSWRNKFAIFNTPAKMTKPSVKAINLLVNFIVYILHLIIVIKT